MVNMVYSDGTLIYVDPPTTTVPLGGEFTITVNIADVIDLYGLDIQLGWNTALLEYVSHVVHIPVEDYPDGVLHEPLLWLRNVVDESGVPGAMPGTLYWLAVVSWQEAPAFTGSGIIFEMTFSCKGVGECALHFYETTLVDMNAMLIPHEAVDGSVVVMEIPTLYLDPAEITVLEGEEFTITVNIANVINLAGFDIRFGWDTSLLEYVSHTVHVPVEDYPDGVLHEPLIWIYDIVNENGVPGATPGTLYWLVVATLGGPGFNGSGIVFEMTFCCIGIGESALHFYETTLVDVHAAPIPHEAVDGSVVVEGITTLYIDPAEITVLVGQVFKVDVKLENVRNLYGFAIGIGYDASCLEFVDWEFPPWNLISARTQEIMWLAGRYPKSGSLTLITLTFRAKHEGSSQIQIYHHQLATIIYYEPARDNVGWPITHTTEDGHCTIKYSARVALNDAIYIFEDLEEILSTVDPGAYSDTLDQYLEPALSWIVDDNYLYIDDQDSIKKGETTYDMLKEAVDKIQNNFVESGMFDPDTEAEVIAIQEDIVKMARLLADTLLTELGDAGLTEPDAIEEYNKGEEYFGEAPSQPTYSEQITKYKDAWKQGVKVLELEWEIKEGIARP